MQRQLPTKEDGASEPPRFTEEDRAFIQRYAQVEDEIASYTELLKELKAEKKEMMPRVTALLKPVRGGVRVRAACTRYAAAFDDPAVDTGSGASSGQSGGDAVPASVPSVPSRSVVMQVKPRKKWSSLSKKIWVEKLAESGFLKDPSQAKAAVDWVYRTRSVQTTYTLQTKIE